MMGTTDPSLLTGRIGTREFELLTPFPHFHFKGRYETCNKFEWTISSRITEPLYKNSERKRENLRFYRSSKALVGK